MMQRNASALLNHFIRQEIAKQRRMGLAAPGAVRSGMLRAVDENGNVRMTETRIYVGLNDSETRKQEYETEKYLDTLKNICRNYKAAFSVDVEEGGYYHEDGTYTEETSLVLALINADRDTVKKIAKDLRVSFHQESVLVTEDQIHGCFIDGDS